MGAQRSEIVGCRVADRHVETAFALAHRKHVPDADAMHQQAIEARMIRQLDERLFEDCGEQPPEVVDVLTNLTSGSNRLCRPPVADVFWDRGENADRPNS